MGGAVEQKSGSTAGSAGASSPEPAATNSAAIAPAGADALPAGAAADELGQRPSFGARGRARRRARYLRKARELAYRDLGGLVFNLHRFGQRNDELVLAKLAALERIDSELRAIETALEEREPVTVLREAGVTACAHCAAIHSSEDRFCPSCGLPAGEAAQTPSEAPSQTPSPASAEHGQAPPRPAAAVTAERQHDEEATIIVRPSAPGS